MQKRILIIEADQSLLRILKDFFERARFDVTICYVAAEGLKLAAKEKYNLIIVGPNTLDWEGIKILYKLKNYSQENTQLLILCDETRQELIVKAGGRLAKVKTLDPFDTPLELLLITVNRMIEQPENILR